MKLLFSLACISWLLLIGPFKSPAQQSLLTQSLLKPVYFSNLQWRNIGPSRGGRVNAVTGVPGQPRFYFMGTTGGGIWKSEDAGLNWFNVSDGFLRTGSIGAITVAPSDPNVIYAGTGEHAVRGVMSSHGDGVYRSDDGGRSWKHIGLGNSRHISSIQVHPQQPDLVYVAVQGAVYGPTQERGIYRSTDGGRNWKQVLYINENTGASDLSLDPSNPRILYAGTWDHQRLPWHIRSGGPGSGLWRSVDGGENWERLTRGLPSELGKTAIAVSPADPRRVYANIEAEGMQGGVYRSNDGGVNWQLINSDRQTVARAWYYIEVVPDPTDRETVYILNSPLLKSIDGGRTFEAIPNPHYDQHALWINPENSDNLILGNDGGACITFDGGLGWSSQLNQPTGQFYRITTDEEFPYHIYSAQQDYSTIVIPSRTITSGISGREVQSVGGGESGFIAFNAEEPRYVYAGSYQGNLTRYDRVTGQVKDIMAYPEMALARQPSELTFRFNWNAPLVTEPLDGRVIYHGANTLLLSRDLGQSWVPTSRDTVELTRNDKSKQIAGGGPFTNEGAGGENYNTLSYIAVSPHQIGEIWVGSDDGLVHFTRDQGQTWQNITPPTAEEGIINSIEISPHDGGTAYVVLMRYKFNDLTPYVYTTKNYGRDWTLITQGFGAEDFVRVVREDPLQRGLLYAGTETGFYISSDNGKLWERFQLNLPVTPITDLQVKYVDDMARGQAEDDLIVSTAGRGIWVLDNITSLRESSRINSVNRPVLFTPSPTVRLLVEATNNSDPTMGANPPAGIPIDFYLPRGQDTLPVEIIVQEADGRVVRYYSNEPPRDPNSRYNPALLPTYVGLNRFYWNLRRDPLPAIPGVYLPNNYSGGMVAPGRYTVRLVVNGQDIEKSLSIYQDKRIEADAQMFQDQQAFQIKIESLVKELHHSVQQLRTVRQQLNLLTEEVRQTDKSDVLVTSALDIIRSIDLWERQIVQPQQETEQDVINFPGQLSAELMDLHGRTGDHEPVITHGAKNRLDMLEKDWDRLIAERDRIVADIESFNDLYRRQQLPAVHIPKLGRDATGTGEKVGPGYRGRND